jgi:hypothetical protein
MLRKSTTVLVLWFVLQQGTGCGAGGRVDQVAPTVVETDSLNYCASMVDELTPPDSQEAWSPNGERYAIVESGCGIVVDTVQERVLAVPIATGPGFWRWTMDSRFAIFRYRNAKGNSMTYVFDAVTWEYERTSGCPSVGAGFLQTWAYCGDYPIALAPNSARFLMENGGIVNLPGLEAVRLQVNWDVDQHLLGAEWSPEGDWLAFVTGSYQSSGGTLYLAQGDGGEIRQVVSIEKYNSLQWAADGTSVAVETESSRYVVEVATMQVQVESISAPF